MCEDVRICDVHFVHSQYRSPYQSLSPLSTWKVGRLGVHIQRTTANRVHTPIHDVQQEFSLRNLSRSTNKTGTAWAALLWQLTEIEFQNAGRPGFGWFAGRIPCGATGWNDAVVETAGNGLFTGQTFAALKTLWSDWNYAFGNGRESVFVVCSN